MTAFRDFLAARVETGGFTTEDTLAVFLPLLRQVIEAHAAGLVAPLDGVHGLQVDGHRVWFAEAERMELRRADAAVRRLQKKRRTAVDVIGETRQDLDLTEGAAERSDVSVVAVDVAAADVAAADVAAAAIERPVFVPGYRSYEHVLGHHDPLTDTFVLGLILASLSLGLDFAEDAALQEFASNRDNLFRIDAELHPFLAKVIHQMTALQRDDRPQDLAALADSLVDYREQDVDIEIDLLREAGFSQKDLQTRHQIILAKLQQRLFEISRRNRLLHYRTTQHAVNLTNASVPLSFDPEHIRPDQIVTWAGSFRDDVCSGKKLLLNKYLNFEEALYLPSLLDKIRAEARKDQAEFGFAQLRLVLCFLRWTNLKDPGKERFDSPLLLLPVKLTKKKAVRDAHQLEPMSNEAEVNPVLRYYLRELYGLQLPELVDLETADLRDLHRSIEQQVQKSEAAVTLEFVEKPRISLIHRRARQRLDQFQKRSRLARRGTRTYPKLDYSYAKSDFRPLGLQLFRQKVQVGETALESMFRAPKRHEHSMDGESAKSPPPKELVREVAATYYQLESEGSGNPFKWEFDLCSVTLGNFKYRKMSLVRDYEALLEEMPDHAAFDAVFSLQPAPTGPLPELGVPFAQRYPVVPCDPTQGRAIGFATSGDSYIIQGPPGTGKSQTITNLIADYVARGKRVLFVCEKRAAIDVVYHRLEQCGLGSLCSLVHDAQADKKDLIMDLSATFDQVTGEAGDKAPEAARDQVVATVERDLDPLEQSHAALQEERQPLGQALRESLVRALELRDAAAGDSSAELSAVEREALPRYHHFVAHRDGVERLYAALRDTEPSGIYRHHPLRLLDPRFGDADRAVTEITTHVEPALARLEELAAELAALQLAAECTTDLATVREVAALAARLASLARRGKIALLDPESEVVVDYTEQLATHTQTTAARDAALAASSGWREPLPKGDVANALAQAQLLEGSFLSFLKPAWWRLRKVMGRCFDFDKAVVRPTWTQALRSLAERYESEDAVATSERALCEEFGFEEGLAGAAELLAEVRAAESPGAVACREFLLAQASRAGEVTAELARLLPEFDGVAEGLGAVLHGAESVPLEGLVGELRGLLENLDGLPEFGHCLVELAKLPRELAQAIRGRDWTQAGLESALLEASLYSELRRDRRINRFDGRQRDRVASQLEKQYDRWLDANAVALRERMRGEFLDDHALIAATAKDLVDAQKARKKVVTKGLKVLQHEFSKTRRYKSIRDLSAGDSGEVLGKLKPVWLMSPLSVSDTLPMTTERFDVVIFDEASQITLEEAVPAIFRAAQIIVVGDEMQLPPTNFFSSRARPEDADTEDLEESVEYDLDSNSFLTHAARNLRSCMLGWHYRSRSESLISFSNQAFYNGELLTVPDEKFAAEPRDEIVVTSAADGGRFVEEVFQRPVGFHFVENGVYESRRNRAEAEYIAELVRAMLRRDTGESIGVVAFSQAQQGEIEEALERLGSEDPEFRDRLETEYEREEGGQFVGLLVKNLENIQGDERDVVIMSVCYGPDPRGKIRMNFGPINLSGGEKRLNVAFSRAKQHMVLVASMRSTAVTNDYNVGANCLKNYLRYAEVSSLGDAEGAARVLHQLRHGPIDAPREERPAHPVTDQLASALEARGFGVDRDIGQSTFRCDLAVRKPGTSRYTLGILIDGDAYFAESDALERDMMKPRLLRNFGWQITHVLTKDWHDDAAAELQRVVDLLAN